jgi:NRPS condensation-like uncharacterized protein
VTRPTRPTAATAPFAVADELTCYYDRASEPANVHLEVRLPGRLDRDALRAATAALLEAEPGLRARRASSSGWRRRYRWEFPDRADADPVHVAGYTGQADLDRQRDAFVSMPPPLDAAPPFLLLLASGPDGDRLLLNAHHARFDGLACLRLLTELGALYGRLAGDFWPDENPDNRAGSRPGPGAADSPDRLAAPGQSVLTHASGRRVARIVRIAPGEGLGAIARPGRPGYGTCLLSRESQELADAARAAGASVNDMLLTALMLTIAGWNASRRPAGRSGLIRITMPVGERVPGGTAGVWANRSRLAAVAAHAAAGTQPAVLLAEVSRQATLAKRRQGPQVDAVSRALTAAPLPAGVKQLALRAALRVAGPAFCDTALLSNLGQVEPPPFAGLPATQVWFSTSAHMPRGLSVGAVSSAGVLRLTFRYRRALLSAADAAGFAARFGTALDQLAPAKAAI